MRVVVVGATGNVGTAVVAALAADTHVTDVIGIARREPDWAPPKTHFVEADVFTDSLAGHFDGADAVIALAWRFQPTHDPVTTWQTNVLGSLRVFDAVATARVPALVYASSVGAYSPKPSDDRPVDESWPTHSLPTASYGREKSYVERVLDAFEPAHPEVRVVRLRPAFMFQRPAASEQGRIFAGRFLPRSLLEPGRLPLLPYPDGMRFQALHSEDAAAAFVAAVTGDHRGAFNVAADKVIDGPTLAACLKARPVAVPRPLVRSGMAAAWYAHILPAEPGLLDLALSLPLLDTTRARVELGWQPQRTAEDAVVELLGGLAAGAGAPTPPLKPQTPGAETVPSATPS